MNLAEQLFLTNVEEIVRSYYHNADEGVDSILLQEVVDAHGMVIDRIVSKVTNINGINV